MYMNIIRFTLLFSLIYYTNTLDAQTAYWQALDAATFEDALLTRNVKEGKIFHLDMAPFHALCPKKDSKKAATILLPSPDNELVEFNMWGCAYYGGRSSKQIPSYSNLPNSKYSKSYTTRSIKRYL
jgi:hypothetical protein